LGIKVAVSGKGGVGKTTIAGALARSWALQGKRVLAVDADPVNHLASTLGIPPEKMPVPLSKMSELIEERTGVAPGDSFGKLFKLNPKVDDIPEKYAALSPDGVRLLVLGTIRHAGSGCFCPENALLRTLLDHLVLLRDDFLVVDMEAGLEHLGRGSSRGLDVLLLIVEPGQRSLDTAARIKELAAELGIKRVEVVLNKANNKEQVDTVAKKIGEIGLRLIASVPFDPALINADLKGVPAYSLSADSPAISEINSITGKLEAMQSQLSSG
jgi:CO dehydrogenase maturation factor